MRKLGKMEKFFLGLMFEGSYERQIKKKKKVNQPKLCFVLIGCLLTFSPPHVH